MYAIPIDGNVRLTRNEPLREYARLEYKGDAVAWILASAPRRRKAALRRPRLPRLRRFARPATPAVRPVACKGVPRRAPEEAAPPG